VKEVYFHPKAPSEARELFRYYESISPELAEEFWAELESAIAYASKYPQRNHFDRIGVGLRRSNLKRFPVHFLYKVFDDYIRIAVIKHDKRNHRLGLKRK